MKKLLIIGIMGIFIPLILFAQIENWVYRYNGPGDGSDRARSIVYGSDGNIYAAGDVYGIYGDRPDFGVISIPSSGPPENWVYAYHEAVNSYNKASSIVYGSDGNLYAAGDAYSSVANATDFTGISLTTSGSEQWTYLYDGGGGAADYAYDVVYGADGNVYWAGNTWTGMGLYWDFTVIKLPPSGPPENWIYKYDGPGSEMDNSDAAYSITYGSDGNIYAAGKSYGSGTWRDFTVVSVTTSGSERWVYRYNGSANSDDIANSIIYGEDGNIYVVGTVKNSNKDIIVVSIPPSGPPANWVYIYNGPGNGDDGAGSIVYGSDGNLYVGGNSTASGSGSDFTVISLTTSMVENWVYRYNGPGNGDDGASSIIYGLDGNIYAAGNSTGSGSGSDFTVISLTTSMVENWVYRYNGPGNGDDRAVSIIYGLLDDNIYAGGYSTGIGTDKDFTVISLDPQTGIQEEFSNKKGILCSCYPNPFHKNVIINYALSSKHYAQENKEVPTIRIYDATGRSVKNFSRLTHGALRSTLITWEGTDNNGQKVPAGVYFVRLESGDDKEVEKVILLR
jgi:hypothetical protein